MLNTSITRLNNNDQTLASLDLESNEIGPGEATPLAEALKVNQTILNLSNKSAQEALNQIHKRGCAERYRTFERVILVGANINSDSHSLSDWKKELL